MRDRIAAVMTRRRLAGAALIVGGLVVAALVWWPSDDEQLPDRSAQRPPVRAVAIPSLGIAFKHPSSWTRAVQGRVIGLRSPDRSAQMTVSSPVAGREPARVKASLEAGLRRSLKDARVVRDGTGRLAGRTVESIELTGRRAGRLVRVLGLVEDTRHRTYAITLVTSGQPSRRVIAQVAQIFGSFRFGEPSKRPASR